MGTASTGTDGDGDINVSPCSSLIDSVATAQPVMSCFMSV